jgi:hypothetical protein
MIMEDKWKRMERKRQWPISMYTGLLIIFHSSDTDNIELFSDKLKKKNYFASTYKSILC